MEAPPTQEPLLDTAELAAIATDHRVRRTFAFIDLCGFTDFVDEHGDHGAVAELQRLRAPSGRSLPSSGCASRSGSATG